MTVENTSDRDPMLHVLGMVDEGSSNYIEGMEAAGQKQVVSAAVMPTDGPWDKLEALGFVRGEPVAGDPIFVNCQLPPGWTKQATDHSMWSKVHDDRGIERVAVFYKAAFYDRSAHFQVVPVGSAVADDIERADAFPDYWPKLTADERAEVVDVLKRGLETTWRTEEQKERSRRALRLIEAGGEMAEAGS